MPRDGGPSTVEKWQATQCPGSSSRQAGTSSAHWARTAGQRVRKRQPDGGVTGLGISPSSVIRRFTRSLDGSGTGSAGNSQATNASGGGAVVPTFAGGTASGNLPVTVTVSGSITGAASVALGGSNVPINVLQPTVAANMILRIQ